MTIINFANRFAHFFLRFSRLSQHSFNDWWFFFSLRVFVRWNVRNFLFAIWRRWPVTEISWKWIVVRVFWGDEQEQRLDYFGKMSKALGRIAIETFWFINILMVTVLRILSDFRANAAVDAAKVLTKWMGRHAFQSLMISRQLCANCVPDLFISNSHTLQCSLNSSDVCELTETVRLGSSNSSRASRFEKWNVFIELRKEYGCEWNDSDLIPQWNTYFYSEEDYKVITDR